MADSSSRLPADPPAQAHLHGSSPAVGPQAAAAPSPPSLTPPSPASFPSSPSSRNARLGRFVAPSSYLRYKTPAPNMAASLPSASPPSPLDKEQLHGLKCIREFLKVRTSYDVLPLSFRLVVLDTDLLIKKSLNILIQNTIVSAPLWDSASSRFAGILTATDYINVIQYYCQFPDEISKLEHFRLSSLRGRLD
ncbi:hypothetical protein CDD82_3080 [Ophiocordyceps australis]|uniref:CBS domain-containing protein n=1 Tax=Ophiocordyceps australis TaxID=1399860 RepID=A0A2C5XUM4_9HYPO|nr:hypothetical protein CDD82_3080 [Ophiocordyceps australis]